MTLNVRSLRKNLDKLEALVYSLESPPSIVCLTETWLNEDHDPYCFLLKGYTQLSSKVRDSRGGGVMIQVYGSLSFVKEILSNLPESICVHLKSSFYNFLVMACYNAPRTNKLQFLDNLDSCFETLPDNIGIVFCGDLNVNTLDDNLITRKYLNSIDSNGFEFLLNQPTRATDESSTCIDHYITRNIMITRLYVMEAENFTDHYPIYLEFCHGSNGQACEKVFRDTSFLKNPKLVKIILIN